MLYNVLYQFGQLYLFFHIENNPISLKSRFFRGELNESFLHHIVGRNIPLCICLLSRVQPKQQSLIRLVLAGLPLWGPKSISGSRGGETFLSHFDQHQLSEILSFLSTQLPLLLQTAPLKQPAKLKLRN